MIRLPLLGVTSTTWARRPADRAAAGGEPASHSRRRRQQRRRGSLALQLQLAGHDVRTANDGMEALEVPELSRLKWCCSTSECPGWTATKSPVRSGGSGGAGRPLVALTGWGQQQDRKRTSDAGFDVHLVKPVTEFDLFQAIVLARSATPVRTHRVGTHARIDHTRNSTGISPDPVNHRRRKAYRNSGRRSTALALLVTTPRSWRGFRSRRRSAGRSTRTRDVKPLHQTTFATSITRPSSSSGSPSLTPRPVHALHARGGEVLRSGSNQRTALRELRLDGPCGRLAS